MNTRKLVEKDPGRTIVSVSAGVSYVRAGLPLEVSKTALLSYKGQSK